MRAEEMGLDNLRGLFKVLFVGLAVLLFVSFLFSGSAAGDTWETRRSFEAQDVSGPKEIPGAGGGRLTVGE
jgi:hypothetical protein